MALVSIGGRIKISPIRSNNGLDINTLTLDADAEKVGFIFQVPKSGTIDAAVFQIIVDTTSQDLLCSLQTVNVNNGDPDGIGSLYGGSGSVTLASASVAVGDHEVTFSTAATALTGDTIAFVIELSGVGDVEIGGGPSFNTRFPNRKLFTTSWGGVGENSPMLSLKYDDGTYEIPIDCVPPLNSVAGTTYAMTDSANEQSGVSLTFPYACRVVGFSFVITEDGTSDNFNGAVFDTSNNLKSDVFPVDTYDVNGIIQSALNDTCSFTLITPLIVAKDETFRFVMEHTGGSGALLTLRNYVIANENYRQGYGFGENIVGTKRTGFTGGWTDSDVDMPNFVLWIDQLSDDAGGNVYLPRPGNSIRM